MNTMEIKCPYCGYEGYPIIDERITTEGWILFVVLLIFCVFLCWIPFVSTSFKEQVVKCPNCGFRLGAH